MKKLSLIFVALIGIICATKAQNYMGKTRDEIKKLLPEGSWSEFSNRAEGKTISYYSEDCDCTRMYVFNGSLTCNSYVITTYNEDNLDFLSDLVETFLKAGWTLVKTKTVKGIEYSATKYVLVNKSRTQVALFYTATESTDDTTGEVQKIPAMAYVKFIADL